MVGTLGLLDERRTILSAAPEVARLRVLILNSRVSGGGPARGLPLYLERAGERIDAHVVTPEPLPDPARSFAGATVYSMPELVERVRTPPWRWARKMPLLDRLLGALCVLMATVKLARLARRLQPDVIYCNHMLAA